jgi:hypothetical protein
MSEPTLHWMIVVSLLQKREVIGPLLLSGLLCMWLPALLLRLGLGEASCSPTSLRCHPHSSRT